MGETLGHQRELQFFHVPCLPTHTSFPRFVIIDASYLPLGLINQTSSLLSRGHRAADWREPPMDFRRCAPWGVARAVAMHQEPSCSHFYLTASVCAWPAAPFRHDELLYAFTCWIF